VRGLADGSFDAVFASKVPDEAYRAAGLSRAKTDAIRDLAAHVLAGDVDLVRAGRMQDDDVVAMLTKVRGVGPWTAQMFLIFDLHRLDVWPTGDYAVRVGYGRAFGLDETPTPRELAELGEAFRPYRTIAAWYCWRSVAPVVTP
jgi:3-methyladenine DNA glycosylase/8-oxoguanine DNA glycosylase